LETLLVPSRDRSEASYLAYYLTFAVADIGATLLPMAPLLPRPHNRLPREALPPTLEF
jgi:hypothetical protein